jgi:hypothetical protein
MKVLSIFVDESGHFDMASKVSPYYLVSFVFHDQSFDITDNLKKLDTYLSEIGYPKHCIHTEPIIRSEGIYETIPPEDRHRLFDALVHFARKSPILYKTFCYRKTLFSDKFSLISRMSRDIATFCRDHLEFLNSFDSINLYYDNGQGEISVTLTSTLSVLLPQITFRRVTPNKYRFFQVADLICTIRLVEEKYKDKKHLSKSEEYFFRNHTVFKKNYLSVLNHLKFH